MERVTLDEIEQRTRDALEAHGARAAVAGSVAHAVRIAEAKGNRICGLYYLESYCNQLRSGRVDGVVDPVVSTDRPGAVRVDAAVRSASRFLSMPRMLESSVRWRLRS